MIRGVVQVSHVGVNRRMLPGENRIAEFEDILSVYTYNWIWANARPWPLDTVGNSYLIEATVGGKTS